MAVTNITTSSGFECSIDEAAMNDMELLDELVALDRGDVLVYSSVLSRLLEPVDKARLYDHVRVNGRVPIDAVSQELGEIFGALNEGKK